MALVRVRNLVDVRSLVRDRKLVLGRTQVRNIVGTRMMVRVSKDNNNGDSWDVRKKKGGEGPPADERRSTYLVFVQLCPGRDKTKTGCAVSFPAHGCLPCDSASLRIR